MNAKAIEELADFIEKTKNFDMNDWVCNPDCGTAGCVFGHAALLWPDVRDKRQTSWEDDSLRFKLEISCDDFESIGFPSVSDGDVGYRSVTKEHAVVMLRNFAETGTVEWPEGSGIEN